MKKNYYKMDIPKNVKVLEIEIPEGKEAEVVDVAGEKLYVYLKEINRIKKFSENRYTIGTQ